MTFIDTRRIPFIAQTSDTTLKFNWGNIKRDVSAGERGKDSLLLSESRTDVKELICPMACIDNYPDYEPPVPRDMTHDALLTSDPWAPSVTQECHGDKNTFNVM